MINPREFFYRIIRSQSDDEDIARRERILNVLLVSCAVLFFASFLISLSQYIVPGYRGLNPVFFLAIILWFGFLYLLSKRKKSRLASYLFLGSFSLLPTYAIFHWGADVVAGLLFYVLVIVMSGILIGNRASLATAGFAIFFITLITYLQINKIVSPVSYWKSEPVEMADTIAVSIIFFIIAVVSWLSSSQIQKSLTRAKKSEADLKAERDSLEIKVEQRTQELKEARQKK